MVALRAIIKTNSCGTDPPKKNSQVCNVFMRVLQLMQAEVWPSKVSFAKNQQPMILPSNIMEKLS